LQKDRTLHVESTGFWLMGRNYDGLCILSEFIQQRTTAILAGVKSMVVDRALAPRDLKQARVVQFNCSDLTGEERWQAVSVYKREDSEFYWFKFKFRGRLYQRPAR